MRTAGFVFCLLDSRNYPLKGDLRMKVGQLRSTLAAAIIILVMCLFLTVAQASAQETVLYNLDGQYVPYPSGVIFDAAGNLYGSTGDGGKSTQTCFNGQAGCGTIFEVTQSTAGWSGKTVLAFSNAGNDPWPPTSLVFDAAGNLYGTTATGGAYGNGTVFGLTPKTGGGWIGSVLYNFNEKIGDGINPTGLTFDAAGNLFGVSAAGGVYGPGTVFKLTRQPDGTWKESVLHSFKDTDGKYPQPIVVFDASGNVYGTTQQGGADGCGTAFELTPASGGGWIEKVLHNFSNNGKDGCYPNGSLIRDAAGSLYGTTETGGSPRGVGTIFELTPQPGGGWSERLLHVFGASTDGSQPYAGLTSDASGNLYGTTIGGGVNKSGTVFKLTPIIGGTWTETVLYSFCSQSSCADGSIPVAGLTLDAAGHLYGTTWYGGAHNYGTVFEITH
jgi:uncharacterized repeat protein (TIGR03803 family)